ncbi:MAG: RDD family protein [Acidobacteriaceae bacterium]
MSTSSQSAKVQEVQPAWKQEINARLSAHRSRRGGFPQQPQLPGMEQSNPASEEPSKARLAARIAERYAKAPTYREVLAAEAAKAARAAEAAAQAAREAQEAADAICAAAESQATSGAEPDAAERFELTPPPVPEPIQYRVDPASLPASRNRWPPPNLPQLHSAPVHSVEPHPRIVDPFEEALVAPAQPLPARVLEFPRELVAPRKARPRYAEGPLRDAASGDESEQLRIFEVEPETISHQPLPSLAQAEEVLVPGWSSIRLDATPLSMEPEMSPTVKNQPASANRSRSEEQPFSSRARRSARGGSYSASLLEGVLPVAPLGDRFTAAMVDIALVATAFTLFLMVFLACTINPPSGRLALIAAALTFVGFLALYEWLFFTFAESTPGMRYAKIALCTFEDENPDRKSLQRRIGACFLAALPLGLGFLWTLLDDDRLGWQDRMTRTYQRSYR